MKRQSGTFFIISLLLASFSACFAQVRVLGDTKSIIYDISFSKGGSLLAATDKQAVNLYDVASGKLLKSLRGGHSLDVNTLDFSQDSSKIVSGGKDGLVVLWDVQSAKQVKALPQHTGVVTKVMFSQDGQLLFSAGSDNKIIVYDIQKGMKLYTFNQHTDDVITFALSPDGKRLASAGADKNILLWDLQTGKMLSQPIKTKDWIRALSFKDEGNTLLSAGDNSRITYWKLNKSNTIFHSIKRSSGWILSLDRMNTDSENEIIAFAGSSGIVQVITSVGGYEYDAQQTVHKVLLKPKEGVFIVLAVATRGKGILLINGKDMKTLN